MKQSNPLANVNLLLAGLQVIVAGLWFASAAKYSSWLHGFVGILFIGLALGSLEIWALRTKLNKLQNEAKETEEKEAAVNVPLDQR